MTTAPPPLPTDVGKLHPTLLGDAEAIWRMKSGGCADKDHYDIQPMVSFFEDDGTLIMSVVANQGRDGALAVARLGAPMSGAALVVMHMDAHVTTSPVNPATGKPWGPGGMQAACDGEGACATGVLTDCIVSQGAFRDGHQEMVIRKYHGHEVAGKMHWADPEVLIEGDGHQRAEGLVTAALREAMADDTFRALAEQVPVPVGFSEVQARWHCIFAALKMMAGIGAVIAVIPNVPQECVKDWEETMTPESIQEFVSGPIGPLLALLRMKWGLE